MVKKYFMKMVMKMLKIKDNVDLKELEKFGFEYNEDVGRWKFCERLNSTTVININVWNRRVLYTQEFSDQTICLTKLYDLIQAGLIEKC